MTTPLLSIIVPTIGRPASMQRLLRSLSAQAGAPSFDVVVVVDGIPAAEAGVGDPRGWPFVVRVVPSAGRGAAAARNSGVRESAGHVLVFLDDDMEVDGGALSAHAVFHAGGPDRIGAGSLTPAVTETGLIGAALAGWWEVIEEQMADPRHRFTFRDVLTGHCSMRRRTFDRVGGFDETLRCHEDFDFGYRALQHGLSIRRVTGAQARHHDRSTLRNILARKREEGRAGVQMAERHPALRRVLPLGRGLAAGRLATLVQRVAVDGAYSGAAVPIVCAGGLRLFEALQMRDKWRTVLERAMDYWYWRGVREQAGSRAAVDALRESGEPPQAERAMTIELADGLPRAELQLDAERPHSLRVLLAGQLVGIVPDVAGAEPLRGVHLRPLLLKYLLPGYLRAAAAAGLMPDSLVHSVRDTRLAGSIPDGDAADQAA